MKNSSRLSEVAGRINSETSLCDKILRNLCQLIDVLLQNLRIVFLEKGSL